MLGAVFSTTNGASVTERTGYTELHDAGYNTPASGLEIITRNSGETASSIVWGSTVPTVYGALAVEINAPAVGAASGVGRSPYDNAAAGVKTMPVRRWAAGLNRDILPIASTAMTPLSIVERILSTYSFATTT